MRAKGMFLISQTVVMVGALLLLALFAGGAADRNPANPAPVDPVAANARKMVEEGRRTFRDDTFGAQVFWSRMLGIDEALKTVSPRTALTVGLKVDSEAVLGRPRAPQDRAA